MIISLSMFVVTGRYVGSNGGHGKSVVSNNLVKDQLVHTKEFEFSTIAVWL